MSKPIIRVENLSKKYIIGHQQERQSYVSLRDVIANTTKSLSQKFNPFKPRSPLPTPHSPSQEEFWALKEVSFDINQGDRVGIIGRNGAGKSTLLKVLSRITEPTSGRICIQGRVASLLEVGTGFHPELTGRENIYLNGAILGMSRVEIKKKFDEIVAFAEVEKFLDTPVKRYSSGMYVRLAFAVAAHLEPEILIVDEVLAVGDAQFQKKCLGKMEDVGKEGRTVIFVSHQMGMMTKLCNKGIYLQQGQVVESGNINDTISKYVTSGASNCSFIEFPTKENIAVTCRRLSITNFSGMESSEIDVRDPFYVHLEYEVNQLIKNVELTIRVLTADGRPVFTTSQSDCTPEKISKRVIGHYKATIEIPKMFLIPGFYALHVSIHEPMVQMYESYDNILNFQVLETGTKIAKYGNQFSHIGVVLKDIMWVDTPVY